MATVATSSETFLNTSISEDKRLATTSFWSIEILVFFGLNPVNSQIVSNPVNPRRKLFFFIEKTLSVIYLKVETQTKCSDYCN